MGRPLWGRCELYDVVSIEGWHLILSTLLSREAFHANKGLQLRGGNPIIIAGDRDDIEPQRVLLKRFRLCAFLWSPLDQKFLHICGAPVVFDASWVRAG